MGEAEPFLRAGWEPDTPPEDTLLRRFLLNWSEAMASQVTALGGRSLRRDDLVASDLGRPAGFLNGATLLRPLDSDREDEVMTALASFLRFGGGSTGVAILFSAWPTPDLRPHGWHLAGHPPLHVLPPGRDLPPPPADLRIEELRDGDGLRTWEAVAVEGYPFEELQPLVPGSLTDDRVLADGRLRFWVGWVGDQPVSASAVFVEHGVAGVVLVATLPAYRRRGFGEALTWRAALAEPALPAVLLSSDPGRPVYDRMGFIPLLRFTVWYRERGG